MTEESEADALRDYIEMDTGKTLSVDGFLWHSVDELFYDSAFHVAFCWLLIMMFIDFFLNLRAYFIV